MTFLPRTQRLVGFLCVTVPLLGAEPLRAASPEEMLTEAVSSYTEALNTEKRAPRIAAFRRAQRLFAAVAEEVENADLYVNLGNAALQAEDLGGSILAYRRGLRLAPDHLRALQNLDHARSQLPAWVPRPGPEGLLDSFFSWHRSLSRELRALMAAACFALAALLVASGIWFRQGTLRNVATLPLLAWVALLASLFADPVAGASEEAVVTVPEVVARAADSRLAPGAFPEPLPSGVEVRVLERRTPWLRVRLANGRDVWLPESSLTRIAR